MTTETLAARVDENKRLRDENDALRASLLKMVRYATTDDIGNADKFLDALREARAALMRETL